MNVFLAFTLFMITLNSLKAEDDPAPLSSEYGIEPSSIYENVNLANRAYTASFVDLEVLGPEPLSFIRYYDHKSIYWSPVSSFGRGVSLNYACFFLKIVDRSDPNLKCPPNGSKIKGNSQCD
ncbi:MAG: hypothetical protein K0S07_43 [Chlamydiales bacterium]|jgi:hypothetical protein|nr:hypothetical protein [Chlamydiales bacterium]